MCAGQAALPCFEELINSLDDEPQPRNWEVDFYRVNYGNCLRMLRRFEDAGSWVWGGLDCATPAGIGPAVSQLSG